MGGGPPCWACDPIPNSIKYAHRTQRDTVESAQEGGKIPRKNLTFNLADNIDNIRSLTPQERRRIMKDGRIVLGETLGLINEKMDDVLWYINRPKDYYNIYREDFGSRMEAVMPRGPPQDKRQRGPAQLEQTLARVREWSRMIKEIDAKVDEVINNLELMGLFYLRRM